MVALAGKADHIEAKDYVLAFFSFFFVVIGGMIVGGVVGLLTALITKHTKHTR